MADTNSVFKIEKLNDENYTSWSFKMKMFLGKEGVWEAVDGDVPAVKTEAFKNKERKALQIIVLSLENNQLVHVRQCETGRDAWQALKEVYCQGTLLNIIRIRRKANLTFMEEGGSMREHINKMSELFDQLNEINAKVDDDDQIVMLLSSVSIEYHAAVTVIDGWDVPRKTISQVKQFLISEWEKKNDSQRNSSVAMLASARKQGGDGAYMGGGHRSGGSYAGGGHGSNSAYEGGGHGSGGAYIGGRYVVGTRGRTSGDQAEIDDRMDGDVRKARFPDQFTCYGCHRVGHIKRNCPDLRRTIKELRRTNELNKEESAKMARFEKWYNNCVSKGESKSIGWFVDSGATCHMCGDKNLFSALDRTCSGEVTVASGQKIKSSGKGIVSLTVQHETGPLKVTLDKVLWVPELDENLVSVKKLTENGFSVEFTQEKCFLRNQSEKMLIAEYDGSLYRIREREKCFQASSTSESSERCVHDWHRRLAHRNLNDIRLMKADGLKIRNCECSDICEMCIKGKMSRKSFPKKATSTENTLDCIVSDVCGPMQIESLGRKRYFVTFIDVHSNYTEVQFIRQRSEVVQKSIEFIERMKTQVGKKCKIFRSDKAKEYLSEKLQSYLRKEGIKFQCTVGYAPEQNGIAERKNRTLVESARSMLTESGLPKSLWAEAVNTSNFVFNRLISKRFNMSPYEVLFSEKPKIKDAYEFGCNAYIMIPYERRKKLDDKAKRVKFIGYDENAKGFRFVDENLKVLVSREAKFLDTKHSFNRHEQIVESEIGVVFDWEDDDHYEVMMEPRNLQESEQEDSFYDAGDDSGKGVAISPQSDEAINISSSEGEISPQHLVQPSTPALRRQTTRKTAGKISERFQVSHKAKCVDLMYEPRTYKQAISSSDANEWLNAMEEELDSIEKNKTWTLVDLPNGCNAVGSKWVFKKKCDETGKIVRYKARLVAQGYSQKFGVDYDEVFAPVARSTTMRLLLSEAGVRGYKVKQYDIKTAFLNGELNEDIYMKQPPGFTNGDKVYKLVKSLYGLRQAARCWNQVLHRSLVKNGFLQSLIDKCLYTQHSGGESCYLLVHVDDILLATSKESFTDKIMYKIGQDFEIKDLGEVHHYLGIDVKRSSNGHFMISQSAYIDKIVEAADLKEAKISKYPVDTGYYKLEGELLPSNDDYRKLIGMLLYLSTNTRPDIAASVSILSKRVSCPRDLDLNEVRRLIRYIKGTSELKLSLSWSGCKPDLYAYSDANWAEDPMDRKSNSGYFCSINGGAISWSCRKQDIIALSSTEAEYVALSETCKEVIWLRGLAKEFDIKVPDAVTIYTDSQSSISIVNNQKFSCRTKHIDTKYHFVRDFVEKKLIRLCYHPTETNVADLMTKPLGATKVKALRELAGLKIDDLQN